MYLNHFASMFFYIRFFFRATLAETWAGRDGRVLMAEKSPIHRWMVYFMENPSINR